LGFDQGFAAKRIIESGLLDIRGVGPDRHGHRFGVAGLPLEEGHRRTVSG
jgi:hypothetical protein